MTPSGQGQMTPNAQSQMAAQQKPMTPSPNFDTFANNTSLQKKLDDILDCFYGSSKNEHLPGLDPSWPEAQGPSYHEVLGQPNPANPLPPVGNMAQPMGGAPWQQQQQPMGQGPQGGAPAQGGNNAPQMMPQQNFMMAQPGQGGQMYQPMYQGPGGGQMPPQGQRPQNSNNMPPQEQQPMGGFNQQGMMQMPPGPGQAVAMPQGMAQGPQGQQGQQMMMMPNGAVPKFGVQMMMVPAGQYAQGGFPPQRGEPGGPNTSFSQGPGQPGSQPGGPPGGPQQQGHWQQHHMMPGQMQQVGPRGPPPPMGGHEG